MSARASWKGFLRIRLVSIPVKAYSAAASGAKIHLNQLHRDCHSPIKYRKVCPVHGEVGGESIVSGVLSRREQIVLLRPLGWVTSCLGKIHRDEVAASPAARGLLWCDPRDVATIAVRRTHKCKKSQYRHWYCWPHLG